MSLKYTTSLSKVMTKEVGRKDDALPSYRCSTGAHRGASVEYLENTLPAIKAAEKDASFAFVEFDVQYTKDEKIVVFHDQRLFRLFGYFDSVGNSTYDELMEMTNGEIALYSDVMDNVTKKLNIEIKSQGDEEEDQRLADAIVRDVYARGREKDVMISSISSDVIRYIRQKYAEIPLGEIHWIGFSTYVHLDVLTERLYRKFSESQADYLMLHVANFRNIENLLKLKPPGKTIMFWDFDDCMYLVHQNRQDRLWGTSLLADVWESLLYHLN